MTLGVQACSVPVFRYALERWQNAPYRAVVLRRGALSEKEKTAVAELKRAAIDARAPANLEVEELDVDADLQKPSNAVFAKWFASHEKSAPLPYVVLCYPEPEDGLGYAWGGKLEAGLAEKICQSPARKEIARRLLSGDTAVWLVLASDDPEKTAKATLNLDAELSKLQKEIALPTDDDNQGGPPVKLISKIPLKISFSILQVKRDDPAESVFVSILGELEKKTQDKTKPAAFAIFGRGRMLAGLSGTDLKADVIRDACYFFAQPCSCRVKELNPGNDLLFAVDWENELASAEEEQNPEPKPPVAPPKPKVAETVKIAMPEKESAPPTVATEAPPRWMVPAAITAGVMLLISAAWVAMSSRNAK